MPQQQQEQAKSKDRNRRGGSFTLAEAQAGVQGLTFAYEPGEQGQVVSDEQRRVGLALRDKFQRMVDSFTAYDITG